MDRTKLLAVKAQAIGLLRQYDSSYAAAYEIVESNKTLFNRARLAAASFLAVMILISAMVAMVYATLAVFGVVGAFSAVFGAAFRGVLLYVGYRWLRNSIIKAH